MAFYNHFYPRGYPVQNVNGEYQLAQPHSAGYGTVGVSRNLDKYYVSLLESKICCVFAFPIINEDVKSAFLIPYEIDDNVVVFGQCRNHKNGNFLDNRSNHFMHDILMDAREFTELIYSDKKHFLYDGIFKDTYIDNKNAAGKYTELSYQDAIFETYDSIEKIINPYPETQNYQLSQNDALKMAYYLLGTSYIIVEVSDKIADVDNCARGILSLIYQWMPARCLVRLGFNTCLNITNPARSCRLLFCCTEIADKTRIDGLESIGKNELAIINCLNKSQTDIFVLPEMSDEKKELFNWLSKCLSGNGNEEDRKIRDALFECEKALKSVSYSIEFLAKIFVIIKDVIESKKNNRREDKANALNRVISFFSLCNYDSPELNKILSDEFYKKIVKQLNIIDGSCDDLLRREYQKTPIIYNSFCSVIDSKDRYYFETITIQRLTLSQIRKQIRKYIKDDQQCITALRRVSEIYDNNEPLIEERLWGLDIFTIVYKKSSQAIIEASKDELQKAAYSIMNYYRGLDLCGYYLNATFDTEKIIDLLLIKFFANQYSINHPGIYPYNFDCLKEIKYIKNTQGNTNKNRRNNDEFSEWSKFATDLVKHKKLDSTNPVYSDVFNLAYKTIIEDASKYEDVGSWYSLGIAKTLYIIWFSEESDRSKIDELNGIFKHHLCAKLCSNNNEHNQSVGFITKMIIWANNLKNIDGFEFDEIVWPALIVLLCMNVIFYDKLKRIIDDSFSDDEFPNFPFLEIAKKIIISDNVINDLEDYYGNSSLNSYSNSHDSIAFALNKVTRIERLNYFKTHAISDNIKWKKRYFEIFNSWCEQVKHICESKEKNTFPTQTYVNPINNSTLNKGERETEADCGVSLEVDPNRKANNANNVLKVDDNVPPIHMESNITVDQTMLNKSEEIIEKTTNELNYKMPEEPKKIRKKEKKHSKLLICVLLVILLSIFLLVCKFRDNISSLFSKFTYNLTQTSEIDDTNVSSSKEQQIDKTKEVYRVGWSK